MKLDSPSTSGPELDRVGRGTRMAGTALRRSWLAATVAILAIALWQGSWGLGWLPDSIPPPSEIWNEFGTSKHLLWFNAAPTLLAAAAGYIIAATSAASMALLVIATPRSKPWLYAAAVTVSSIPLIALTPMLVLLMNRGAGVRVTVAALASFLPIFVGFIQGFGAVDESSDELFRALSAHRWQRFRYLVFPGSLPYVFAGLKIAAASAVLGAIVAEWAGAGGTRGIGQLMVNSLFSYNVPQTWLTIVASALMAVAAYALVALAEASIVRWDHSQIEVGL